MAHRKVEKEEEEWEGVSRRDRLETACVQVAEQMYRTRGECPVTR